MSTRTVLLRPVTGTCLRESAYLLLGGLTGTLAFSWAVTAVSTSASLAVLVIGLPVAALCVLVDRLLCDVDRRRAALVLGAAIPRPYARRAQDGRSVIRRWLALLADATTWRDLAWMLFGFPVTVAGFCVVATVWATVLGLLTLPIWAWSLPADANLAGPVFGHGGAFHAQVLLAIPAGVLAAVLGAWLISGSARVQAAMAGALLRPSREEELAERVETLTETRSGAVEASLVELQRVERDLHDGAQARLVALTIELGRAEQKLAGGDDEAARELLAGAREQATTAMGELRDLVRGIGPSILRDRGLEAALVALAAGRTPPVTVHVDLPPGEPDARQTALYYVCAESIVNATRHADATRIEVRAWEDVAGRLVAEITDDGRGGADPAGGTGLRGLAQRVAALDGTLTVTSPSGGPTTIRAQL